MNIIYFNPNNYLNPHLFPTFQKTFGLLGHNYTEYPQEATHCFIELISGEVQYDIKLRDVFDRKIPVIVFDNREYGTMNNERWNYGNLKGDFYFVRNYNRNEYYPNCAFQFDWPYFKGCDFEPTTKEELFSRPYDVSLVSVESPTRKRFIEGIYKYKKLKVNRKFLDHTQRLTYNEWINEHRKAKLYISCDGGGYTNERPNQLFSIAPMLKNKSNHLPAYPFTDGINCIEINEEPTEQDIQKVVDIISDKDWLYDIYINGINHTKKYLSEEAVAKYVLSKIDLASA